MSQSSSNSSTPREVPTTPTRRTIPVNQRLPTMRTMEFVDLRDEDDDVIMNSQRRFINIIDDRLDSGYYTPPPSDQ